MTHELKIIISAFEKAKYKGLSSVLVTVVALDGSSYRKPGVRMLILENGQTIGAVSGGCVEKEIAKQADSVFSSGMAKVMSYDGRYRLGCEGIIYLLIEPFNPTPDFLATFWDTIAQRNSFSITSYFELNAAENPKFGSFFTFLDKKMSVAEHLSASNDLQIFHQQMEPCFRLLIIGAEHDAVQLCSYAALTGWEVTVCTIPTEEKTVDDFPGAERMQVTTPEALDVSEIDNQTAIVLMTHSFAKDVGYLLALKHTIPAYIGFLGPVSRREKLLNEFIEQFPEVSEAFLENIHGPAGLDIGAQTPQEIAVAIIAEILAVQRKRTPKFLKDSTSKIHN
ncbi:XdhC family protein [Cellulophaga sp. F20128]|uniref:XdhC family protein n=1 Tax=Cellulophaga sp. F20128 TaxID=2926413 RepID=UPI001FF6EC4E|nr:XdhC/CoxI family protein [Cellulophaga sp. F20128]MCK0158172.1 XdhC family protein [Cellulophaga sp. F20128]